jgi:pSer/pThr/pTyr-binding forkhead associated (FHA) protein
VNQSKTKSDTRGVLLCTSGAEHGSLVKLRRDSTIFGREKADIILEDPEVSATHFQIQRVEDAYLIFDMNSSNGTYVNHQKIVKTKLSDGDQIVAGKTTFQFKLEDEQAVRHIPTLVAASTNSKKRSRSLVDTLIETDLRPSQKVKMLIKVTYGNKLTEVIKITQSSVYIGRASSFGKFDQDTEISRQHLLVKVNETGEVFVEDQGSTNGSFINGKRIQGMHLIKSSDLIKVGRCLIHVAVPNR